MSFETIKATLFLGCLENKNKHLVEITFKEDSFRISFLKSSIKLNEIFTFFYPLYIHKNTKICVNYSYIKKISIEDSTFLKLVLYSPSSQNSIFSIVLSNIEFSKSIFSKGFSHIQNLQKLVISVLNKKQFQILKLRKQLFSALSLLNQLVSAERKYNQICEKMLIIPFAAGKIYQDKCLKELAKNKNKYNNEIGEEVLDQIQELKKNVKNEEIIKKQNVIKNELIKERKSSSDLDAENDTENNKENEDKNKEDRKTNTIKNVIIDEEQKNNKSPENKFLNFGNIGLSRIMNQVADDCSFYFQLKSTQSQKKNIFENYYSYRLVNEEIKISASYFIEKSTELLFTVLNIDKDYFNGEDFFVCGNSTPKIIKHSTSVNPSPTCAQTEANLNVKKLRIKESKMSDRNWNRVWDKGDDIDIFPKISEDEPKIEDIMKKINFCKDGHTLFPCNTKENILVNTGEIIHRKFFERFFDFYFKNIFNVNLDKNKISSIDEINDLFLALKRLKFNIYQNN